MNGGTYATYLQVGSPEAGLLDHWEATVPGFQSPRFVSEIPDSSQVFAYLPCESIKNHVNDPHIHYHMAGKDAIHLMTDKTTKLLQSTKVQRPCIAKTTHSMGSKGIFIIRNDEDEAEFEAFCVIREIPPTSSRSLWTLIATWPVISLYIPVERSPSLAQTKTLSKPTGGGAWTPTKSWPIRTSFDRCSCPTLWMLPSTCCRWDSGDSVASTSYLTRQEKAFWLT